MKKYITTFVTLAILLTFIINVNVTYGDSRVASIASTVMDAYKCELLSCETEQSDLASLMSNTSENHLFLSYLDWRTEINTLFNIGFSDYNYIIEKISYTKANGIYSIALCISETFQYANGIGQGGSNGITFNFDVINSSSGITILSMSSDEDYFLTFKNSMGLSQRTTLSDDELEFAYNNCISALKELKSEIETVTASQSLSSKRAETSVSPRTLYSYSSYIGTEYAQTYALTPNPYFYSATADCTNFVSQCIWAAYGGWNTSMSSQTMANNITNKVRMVPGTYTTGWFAGSGGGAQKWESVNALWTFATSNTGNGPVANGYNNGGYYTDLLPIDISSGDVIQISSSGSDYYHSMYVISTPGGSNPDYSEILVAQHSSNKIRTLLDAMITNGYYIRQLHFLSGSFDS